MSISQQTLRKLIEKKKLVNKSDLTAAYKISRHLGCSITDVLLGRDLINEADLGEILAKYYKVKFVDLGNAVIPKKVLKLIPEQLAVERGAIAFGKKNGKLHLALEDPKDLETLEVVRKTIGNRVRLVPHVATTNGIKQALKLYKEKKEEEELQLTEDVSTVAAVDKLLEDAITEESSDIHIEPLPNQVLARFRIDGVLHDQVAFPKEMHSELVARIKVLADLKLDEHRHPQDGQFPYETKRGEKVSLRVSTVPTVYGEKVVLRILQDTLTRFNLEELGLLPEDQEVLEKVLVRTHGMLLITGPTGSGKTTTLYTTLGLLNDPSVNIVTIEDPVENKIRRVNQIQVNPGINLTFASGLRSMLRQDPDIIMVGEIRDRETAVIAVNAAMTGHLVLSSVHANTAAGAIPRMLDLGTEPFLLASTLNLVIAQRLVRVLCQRCKEEAAVSPILQKRLGEVKDISLSVKKMLEKNYSPKGCSSCYYTGFKGRTGIFEVLLLDEDIQALVLKRAPSGAIWGKARRKGSKSMLEDGLIKVAKGATSLEEVFRVTSE